jgi:uncharacterized RmlC-like cupin family protein
MGRSGLTKEARMARAAGTECVVIRAGEDYVGKQGLTYFAGASAETAGTQHICMHLLTIPPGGRANAHLHERHESVLYLVSGEIDFWFGPDLVEHRRMVAGDFVYIPPGVPHLPVNFDPSQTAEAIISRTDPNEQESVVLLPELDGLAHVQARPSKG